MIKLFEKYVYNFDHKDREKLLLKMNDFIISIKYPEHKVVYEKGNVFDEYYLSIVKEVNEIKGISLKEIYIKNVVVINGIDVENGIVFWVEPNCPYLSLEKYLSYVVQNKFTIKNDYEDEDGIYVSCFYSASDEFNVDDFEFSKEEYEIFKDSERFGLW